MSRSAFSVHGAGDDAHCRHSSSAASHDCIHRALQLNLFAEHVQVKENSVIRAGRLKTAVYLLGMTVGLLAFIFYSLQHRSDVSVTVRPSSYDEWQQLSVAHPDLSCTCAHVSTPFSSFLPPFPEPAESFIPWPGVDGGFHPDLYDWSSIGMDTDDSWCAAHALGVNIDPGTWFQRAYIASACCANLSSSPVTSQDFASQTARRDHTPFYFLVTACQTVLWARHSLFAVLWASALTSSTLLSTRAFEEFARSTLSSQQRVALVPVMDALGPVLQGVFQDPAFGSTLRLGNVIVAADMLLPFQTCNINPPPVRVDTYTRAVSEANFNTWLADNRTIDERGAAWQQRIQASASSVDLFWGQLPSFFIRAWNLDVDAAHPLYYSQCAPSSCVYTDQQRIGTLLLLSSLIGIAGGLNFLIRLAIELSSRTLHVCCSSSNRRTSSAEGNGERPYARFAQDV